MARNTHDLKRAVGYVRVSQVGGREGDSFLSPDVQREKIQAWASYRDYRIVDWYVDLDVSGRAGVKRPEFERMMAAAAERRFEAVAVYRLTRFARSVADAARRYAELRQHGVALVSVTEDIDTTTASGSFMQNMLFAMAEFESQRIGEEWRNVHANRRRRGIAHAPSGIYGYRVEGSEPVALEDAQASAIRLIFERRLRGDGYTAIQDELQRQGFMSPRGHSRFSKATLHAILANPTYAGLVRLSNGQLLEGRQPAIVQRDAWEQVQQSAKRVNAFARHRGGLLAGLLVCHACGYRLRAETKNGRYRCPAKDQSEPCPSPVQISKARVDDYIESLFLRRFDPARMPNRGRVKATRQQQTWTRKAAKLRSRAAELDRALDQLADQRYVKGSLAEAEYHRLFERYATERQDVIEQADELEAMARQIRPLDRDVLALWPTLDVATKRKALRLLIAQIVVKPYTGKKGAARFESVGKRLEIGWVA